MSAPQLRARLCLLLDYSTFTESGMEWETPLPVKETTTFGSKPTGVPGFGGGPVPPLLPPPHDAKVRRAAIANTVTKAVCDLFRFEERLRRKRRAMIAANKFVRGPGASGASLR